MNSKILVTCVRHGQTQANKEGRFIGSLDQSLLEIGKNQAESTAEFLLKQQFRFEKILCSPLKRCIETAEIIQNHFPIPMEILPELRERNYGIFEGLTSEEATIHYPEIYSDYKKNKPFVSLPKGETAYDVEKRIEKLLNNHIRKYPPETHLLIVTHLNPIRAFLRLLGLVDWDIYFRPFKNASITQILINATEAKIILFDQVNETNQINQQKFNPDC
jgi:broad specificity phosphatase PhoE